MADAQDLSQDDLVPFQLINKIKNSFQGASAPTNPVAGVRYWDTGNSAWKVYNGASWVTILAGIATPPGMVTAWAGGYFTDGSNGGYTVVLGGTNDVSGANSYLNSFDWYVCDGSALNDSGSPIFNGASRYLPNLTDDRFIMGDTAIGETNGSNTMAHTHGFDVGAKTTDTESGPAVSAKGFTVELETVADDNHTHGANPPAKTSDGASNAENRPKYLSCFYIMKVK